MDRKKALVIYTAGTFGQLLIICVTVFLLRRVGTKMDYTKSLWICVMTHALINVLSQTSSGGNDGVVLVCRGIIIVIAIVISAKAKQHEVITVQKEAEK